MPSGVLEFRRAPFRPCLWAPTVFDRVHRRRPGGGSATVTGSEGAGRSVASIGGTRSKKTVLELGGADPLIVMPSADLDGAVELGVWARVQNNGQSCIAAKRSSVHEEQCRRVPQALRRRDVEASSGRPNERRPRCGPLATARREREVNAQGRRCLEKGAKAICGWRGC